MVNVDIYFNYGGEWIREPIVLYKKRSYNLWRGYDSDLFLLLISSMSTLLDLDLCVCNN
ncbi:hypothetical protein MTR67_014675 [Solanum verrucosum]|uniref:Uncharacterized protein n=1 Tax=Solanum verrucosum TaxID=315347 RepID=A0AAF0QFF5_SOLVR|nr:hypothetical protein MTR67_014675 [Solanum verrucosum]